MAKVLCLGIRVFTTFFPHYNLIVFNQNKILLFFGCIGNRLILTDKKVRIMVFNATFNNISVISWWSVLLLEETRVPGENHRPAASHLQTLSQNVVSSTPRLSGIRSNIEINLTDKQKEMTLLFHFLIS